MRIGLMRNKIQILHIENEQDELGTVKDVLNPYLTVMASVNFEKTIESGSKFNEGWSNQLVVKTRYSNNLMSVIDNRSEYKIQYQGELYSIKNYEIWNAKQDYVTFYIQKDR